jgi:endoglucanase
VSGQPWFTSPEFPSNLPGIWQRHWAYLKSGNVAPVLMGEFGGRSVGQDTEGVWQRRLVSFLKQTGVSYTYWSWNPDSGDTGGLLQDDWQTINRPKLDLLSTYLWPRASST